MQNIIECRMFHLTLLEADIHYDILDSRRKLARKQVYARVSFSVDSITEGDENNKYGETKPPWKKNIKYIIGESEITRNFNLVLVVRLYRKRFLREGRYIGEAHVSVRGLFDYRGGSSSSSVRVLSLPVRMAAAGSGSGKLRLSYRFGKKIYTRKPPFRYGNNNMVFLHHVIYCTMNEDEDIEAPIAAARE